MSGVKVREDGLKEHHGDLDIAKLFEVEYDKEPFIVEDDHMYEDEPEEAAGEGEVEENNIDEFKIAMPVPPAPPEHALLATLASAPHFWPRIVSGECPGGKEVKSMLQRSRGESLD
ncbi:hypothetical protein RUND412_004570 [Rhizina undulata]